MNLSWSLGCEPPLEPPEDVDEDEYDPRDDEPQDLDDWREERGL